MTVDRFGRTIRAGSMVAWPRGGDLAVGIVREEPVDDRVDIAFVVWEDGDRSIEEWTHTKKVGSVVVLSPLTVPYDGQHGMLHEISRRYASG